MGAERDLLEARIERAKWSIQNQDDDRAIADARSAIETSHQLQQTAYAVLARALQARGDAGAAIDVLTDKIESASKFDHDDKRLAFSYAARGQSFFAVRDYEAAIRDYDESLKRESHLTEEFAAESYFERGKSHLLSGHVDQAIADFSDTLRRAPMHAEAFRWRAILFMIREDYARSAADWGALIRLQPEVLQSYAWRSVSYHLAGDGQLAAEDARHVAQTDADVDPAVLVAFQASEFMNEELFEMTVTLCSIAIRLDPELAYAYSTRGNALGCLGDHERAIEDCSEAVRRDPESQSAWDMRGLKYFLAGQYEHALADFNESIRRDPNYGPAYHGCGLVYAAAKDYDRAVSSFSKAIELDPSMPVWYIDRANAYRALGNDACASADEDKAAKAADSSR